MQKSSISIPADIVKRARFVVAGLAVSLAVLIPGAFWYKGAVRSMADSHSHEIAKMLNVRLKLLRQKMVTELALASNDLWVQPEQSSVKRVRRELPFDLVAVFGRDRRAVDGFRLIASTKTRADLVPDAAARIIPADSRFFDQVTESKSSSGILMVDSQPLLVAVRLVSITGNGDQSVFVLAGRWLDGLSLVGETDQADSGVELFSLMAEETMTMDVQQAVSVAQRNKGFTYVLGAGGEGFVYTLLDDISDRPAIISKAPWTMPWKTSGSNGFGVFYLCSLFSGISAWALLTWNDTKNKRRVRRFDGLSSLSVDHIRTLVEAFPGYAFAINAGLEYVGVSRILAGVTGQECSYFAGQVFGSIASERENVNLVNVFNDLRDPKRWPRTTKINHFVEGLGHRHEFSGMAHYLAKQDLLLVILTHQDVAEIKNLPVSDREASSHQAVA